MVEKSNDLGEIAQPLRKIPIGSAEDVEFSDELADEDDVEAMLRADEASQRMSSNRGE